MRSFLRRNAVTLALVALACAVLGALAAYAGIATAGAAFIDAGTATGWVA